MLSRFGFNESNKGKTSGSRVKFERGDGKFILLHKPHPGDVMSSGNVEDLINFLRKLGEI
ncbi:MAG: type II toxin-antitoxin system HicA family toxin [Synergistaceae bacterium]|nr:type II toxin-antitoxin system HicA family toxin [Synergistaceae bacterium]